AADGVQYANDQAEAVENAHIAEYAFCSDALSTPLWTSTGFKAVSRTYSGEETPYDGQYWEGFVNVPGYGVDSGYSFLNMHTTDNEYGNYPTNNMTIRYGFKVQGVKQFNPIYAEWLWDNTVIDLVGYDSLLGRNPYDLGEFMPMVALQYSAGTYAHPLYGTCSKVVFTLRPDVEWQDGTPVTIADIFFTFVEIDGILESRGFAPPWWISNVQDILSLRVLDPCNFEVLLDVKSVFAVGWVGGNRILPKHIWKPICTTGDPSTDEPDPNMIGSGAWRMNEYEADHHILLTANAANKAVKSPLAGSTPITSVMGYYRYAPIIAYANATNDYSHKFNVSTSINSIDVHFVNGKSEAVVCDLNASLYWNGTLLDTQTQTGVSLDPGDFIWHNPWNVTPYLQSYGLWKVVMNATFPDRPGSYGAVTHFWVTLKEDITGSTWYQDAGYGTYAYKNELVSGDFKVDTKDVAAACKAFGTAPGNSRWNTGADINKDYVIDVKDIAQLAKKFGWGGKKPLEGKTYGGTGQDYACSLVQNVDGSYAFAGWTTSFGAGLYDAWLVKTYADGNQQWSKTYGGVVHDYAYSLVKTSDGGYAFAGITRPFDGDNDAWLVKTDAAGNQQWSKTYGGTGDDVACSLVQNVDESYAFAGYTNSFGFGGYNAWLVKTDANGHPG
ncbi:ABC transporter substrate-binding protein, partial [Candidatus Bathyarchaeota archaeon]|nr:ABC transporter substrate-binding protein [Candidatus Bathyarchaeota archaeon]